MQIYKTVTQKNMKWQGLGQDKMSYHQAPSCNYIRKQK